MHHLASSQQRQALGGARLALWVRPPFRMGRARHSVRAARTLNGRAPKHGAHGVTRPTHPKLSVRQ